MYVLLKATGKKTVAKNISPAAKKPTLPSFFQMNRSDEIVSFIDNRLHIQDTLSISRKLD